ncbi:MAG TPA: ActS/PrrB/RegB family redox-sensitive histidine kinase [Caulobacteraceae bacterium]|jgi:two-component system sensor histidine kinase RegB|nr:ActS/PrrB/RegB family redox-sensitive histidine kinase [Caulobacteraceae bacterium]
MSSVHASAASSLAPGAANARPVTPGVPEAQGRGQPSRGIRTGSLVAIRAAMVLGQSALLLVVWRGLGWSVPARACGALIVALAIVNVGVFLSPARRRKAESWEITAQLAFDIMQLAALLGLTGGLFNPLDLLLIIPVTVAGGSLPARRAAALCALAAGLGLLLAFVYLPPPWPTGGDGAFNQPYAIGSAVALMIALAFATGYTSWTSGESARKELALHVTETVLAREQRLSALGALAAAAAHELGTPLATITVVAKEMVREAGTGPFAEDARLLMEQAQRCRDILKRLAETPEQSDVVHERLSLLQLVREVVEPFAASEEVRVEALVTGPPSVAAPDLWRRPEILHAVTAFVENAFDFARTEILVTARFDAETVAIEVRDDGPGFPPQLLARLGEPYVTSRPGAEGSRTGHVGMGLGMFIAKTLLERTGAKVEFRNGHRLGAIVTARWQRDLIEAQESGL